MLERGEARTWLLQVENWATHPLTALFDPSMVELAADGNLDFRALARASSLPTVLKLLGVPELRERAVGVLRTIAASPDAAEVRQLEEQAIALAHALGGLLASPDDGAVRCGAAGVAATAQHASVRQCLQLADWSARHCAGSPGSSSRWHTGRPSAVRWPQQSAVVQWWHQSEPAGRHRALPAAGQSVTHAEPPRSALARPPAVEQRSRAAQATALPPGAAPPRPEPKPTPGHKKPV